MLSIRFRESIKRYKTQLICGGIFFFHLLVSHIILPSMNIINLFPFYDWNLFSYNSTIQTWPMIRVIEIDHAPVKGGDLIYHNGIILNAVVSGWVPEQMRRLLVVLESNEGENETAKKYREELEKNIFHSYSHVKYEFFSARINVRKFFHDQEIIESYKSWNYEYQSNEKKN